MDWQDEYWVRMVGSKFKYILLMLETLCKFKYIFWSGWVLSFKHETQSRNKTQQWTFIKPGKIHLKTEEWQQFVLQDDVVLFTVVHVARDPVEQILSKGKCTQSSTTSTRDVLKRQQTGHQPLGPWTALPRWDKSQGLGQDQGLGEDAARVEREPTFGKSFYQFWRDFSTCMWYYFLEFS